jgi:transcriptional regulator with XRE-family HTH domain
LAQTGKADRSRERSRKVEALRWCRLRAGYSEEALARASGVNRGAIHRAESGENSPSVRTLERMAAPLGVSAAQILAAEDVLAGQLEKALQTK